MEVKLKTIDLTFAMEALTDEGQILPVDADTSSGGSGRGATPRQLFLAAWGTAVTQKIMENLRHHARDFSAMEASVQGDGDGAFDERQDIHLHLVFFGTLTAEEIKEALDETQNILGKFSCTFQIFQ